MKRKVVLYIAQSLDGYIADKKGKIDFLEEAMIPSEEKEVMKDYQTFLATIGTVVMGSHTYEQIITELSPDEYPYGQQESIVLTSRTNLLAKQGVSFSQEDVVSLIKQLQISQCTKGDIWIVGGSQVIQPLVENNVIDEYILTTAPVILGQGIPLFKKISQLHQLKIMESKVQGGFVTTTYSRKEY